MGFWDTAGKVAQGALNAIEEKGAEIQSIKMRYEDKSSGELRDIVKGNGFFSASNLEKQVALKILRERGDE
ncbi:transposase [Vitreoscilla massiliensis]|uniref:Transposase n=1 Tax=Vitreoscilla massiliensis TaxID=1689272 RepID=A0ABY4E380_9NEIS|nr:hypothetical protein [Vitreoscilla massiliensis]UOO90235.1 transposase [Vitreoscilla massiliensis]